MTLFIISLFFGAIAVFASMWAFDTLVRRQYDFHREEWVASGKPCGFFFAPPNTSHWGGDRAMKSLHLRWLFSPPTWVKEKDGLKRALLAMRASSAVAFVGIVLAGIAAFRL